jgi:hypothetical protein
MQEECRHILFFANWFAWHRRQIDWWQKSTFRAKCLRVFGTVIKDRLSTANHVGGGGENFIATGHTSLDLTINPAALMKLCLEENDRRF